MEHENPIIYFDPKTKKIYDMFDVVYKEDFPDNIKSRLHTRILAPDGKQILEIESFKKINDKLYKRLQIEYKALGGSEKLYEFFEAYPELLYMTHIEAIDWSPISADIYHTREHYITSKKERTKILNELRTKFNKKYEGKKQPVNKIYVRLYYRKKLRGERRSPNIYRREVKYDKFTTRSLRQAIADVVDKISDGLDYYYVIAERKSEKADGMEYRTILGRTEYK